MISDAAAWWNPDWPYRTRVQVDGHLLELEEAGAQDSTVLLKLHAGNFDFFFNLREDAGDLRFIASDDQAVYPYHVETFDPAAGIALIWVRLPDLRAGAEDFWMYYGNPAAEPGSSPSESFGPTRALTLHFSESDGAPLDSTSFGNRVEQQAVALVADGIIGRYARFEPSSSLVIEASPVLALGAPTGTTLSFWLALDEAGDDSALRPVVSQTGELGAIALGAQGTRLVMDVGAVDARERFELASALAPDRWYHVAVAIDSELRLYLDGELVLTAPAPSQELLAPLKFGATGEFAGFAGRLDEVSFERLAQPPSAIRAAALNGSRTSAPLILGGDETRGGDKTAAYFSLFASLFDSVGPEGWIVLALLAVVGLFALDVLFTKFIFLNRVERADGRFLAAYRASDPSDPIAVSRLAEDDDRAVAPSLMREVYRAAVREVSAVDAEMNGRGSSEHLLARVLDIARAAMEVELVRAIEHLNARMVVLTIAISGGPFLGLLGTVLGVMITFATIAAQGEVNVSTIAPGVAAALTTTVMGLVVAIPSMFGYNYLAGRIARRVSTMEVFAEQVIARLGREMTVQRNEG